MGKLIIINNGNNIDLSKINITSNDILQGKIGINSNGEYITGNIPSISSKTITPKTTNQTINAGNYLSGNITISGDADLIAANIKSGKNIFGVTGTCKEYKSINDTYATYVGRLPFKVKIGGTGGTTVTRTLPCIKYTGHGFTPIVIHYKQGYAWNNGIGIYSPSMNAIEMNIERGYYYYFSIPDNENIIINSSTIQVPLYSGSSDANYGYISAAGY